MGSSGTCPCVRFRIVFHRVYFIQKFEQRFIAGNSPPILSTEEERNR